MTKGDRVAIVMRNLPEWASVFFGAALVGAIVTPLNAWWTGPELEYGLVDSGTKIAFVDAERLERIAERLVNCPDLKAVYVSRDPDELLHPIVRRLEDVTGVVNDWGKLPAGVLPDVALGPEDDATILYTSGTTGKPKGALGTHRNMISNIFASASAGARNFLRRGEAVPVPDPNAPQRATLLSVPFFHATGCFAVMGPSVFAGAKIVLMRKWDAELAMQLIQREKVNSAGGVPTIAWQLIEHPARAKYDLSSLEIGGLWRRTVGARTGAQDRGDVPQIPAQQWLGHDRNIGDLHLAFAEDYEHRPDSCGPAVAVCDLKIMDPEATRDLAIGEVGELWARGPNIVKGYWNKPEATAQTFVDGWVRTGDLARLDTEGFCFIVDRAKDMLIRGGENIYCIEVENVLYEHPAVMDAALVAVPHHTLGEEPGAVVHLKPGMHTTEGELRAFVAGKLAAFKVPVKVVFWPQTLPRNANGKILKTELKKIFAA